MRTQNLFVPVLAPLFAMMIGGSAAGQSAQRVPSAMAAAETLWGGTAVTPTGRPAQLFDTASLLVRFKPGAAPGSKAQARAQIKGQTLRAFSLVSGLEQVSIGGPGLDVEKAIQILERLPFVEYAQPNHVIFAADTFPDDGYFPEQWALHNTGQDSMFGVWLGGTPGADIHAPAAWDVTTTSDVVVAIIDTGIAWEHPDLAPNVWTNPGEIASNGVDDDGNGYVDDVHGWDFFNNDNDPLDGHGHGSHVAGIVAAAGNDGVGTTGVLWQGQVMALKALSDEGMGYLADAVAALEYAVQNGARVSNNSWGYYTYVGEEAGHQALYDAIAAAQAADHLFVAAAGNESLDNDALADPHYPSSFDLENIIAVASTDNTDALSWFSNYGLTSVDVGAPGSDVFSTWKETCLGPFLCSYDYAWLSGTSMASPHVAAVAAMVYGRHPDWTYEQVRDRVFNSVRPVAALEGITVTGGVVDASAAVGPELIDTCGAPTITPSLDQGIFAWEDCASGVWTLLFAGGGASPQIESVGSITADQPWCAGCVTPQALEVNDAHNVAGNAILFDLFVLGAGSDSILFDPQASTSVCLDTGSQPLFLGPGKVPVTHPIDLISQTGCVPALPDYCVAPGFAPASDSGIYLWRDCVRGVWHMVLSAGGVTVPAAGSVSSDAGFDSITPVSFEPTDIQYLTSNDVLIYDLWVTNAGTDGIDFEPSAGANLCFDPGGVNTYLGSNPTPFTTAFNPATGVACTPTPPPAECLPPTTDPATNPGIYLQQDCATGTWELKLAAGGSAAWVETIGSISSTTGFAGTSTAGLEADDVVYTLTAPDPDVVAFSPLRVMNTGTDLVYFQPAAGATVCIDPGAVTAYLGAASYTAPFDLATGALCASALPLRCGPVSYSVATETGVFLWEDCATGDWTLRLSAGGSPSWVQSTGSIGSDTGFARITSFSFEGPDNLDTTDPHLASFFMQVINSGQDGIDFAPNAGADLCVDTGAVAVYLGASRTPVIAAAPFDPTVDPPQSCP